MRTLALVLAVAVAVPPAPRRSARRPRRRPVIPVTAAEVAVDFVVRDKKGRIVRDLRPSDVEVLEDGVRQEVALFQLVSTSAVEEAQGSVAAGTSRFAASRRVARGAAPAPPAPDVEREAVLALVFDRLSPVARRTACDAALEWVKRPAVQGRAVGVFRIDQGLEQLQPFTDDRGPVFQALDDVVNAVPTAYSSREDRERMRTLRQQIALIEGRVASAAGPLSAADSSVPMVAPDSWRRSGPAKEVARRQLSSELAMLQALESLERDQQGLATTNALLALVSGLKTLPGRKAVVFFSEGLVLPDRVVGTLSEVISEANRGGVSFYAADAAGLRTKSAADEMRRELTATSDALQAATESDSSLGARSGMTRLLERNEDALRFDPASGLGALARETGGFLIRDTNDISGGLGRVEEELGAYYLLSYSPKNEAWDGRYRRIEVRPRRSGRHASRPGAATTRCARRRPRPCSSTRPRSLARLETAPRSRDLPVRARALQFPAEDGDSVLAIAAELPGGAPSLRPGEADELVQDFTVMALVRDALGPGRAQVEPPLRARLAEGEGGRGAAGADPVRARRPAAAGALHGGGGRLRRPGGHVGRRPGGGRDGRASGRRAPVEPPGGRGPRRAQRPRRGRAVAVPGPPALPDLRRGGVRRRRQAPGVPLHPPPGRSAAARGAGRAPERRRRGPRGRRAAGLRPTPRASSAW